ncbi:MAG: hypothetical protein IH940_10245 [Acidobacteria bacterium]|nr:hypothetical protein [Acidobacteriota bacterium]
MAPSEATLRARVGHRFPGGTYRIAHWENFLFTDATCVNTLPDELAHPASLFHVAINGAGTSIEELFEIAQSRAGAPISIGYYDWRIHQPLREEQTYSLSGGISDFARRVGRSGTIRDSFTYEIGIEDSSGAAVGDVEFCWHFWRQTEPVSR